jgi:hypothetical protein
MRKICFRREVHFPLTIESISIDFGGEMLISTILENGKCCLVKSYDLQDLIMRGKVQKFMRFDGWVTVGCHPVRIRDSNYDTSIDRRLPAHAGSLEYILAGLELKA